MKKIKELLPIGTVVLLKNASKKLMIYGVMQSDTENNQYDYVGVLYPEGSIGPEGQFLFQHEDIDQIFYRGYEDDERNIFINKLDEYYSNQQ